MSSLAAKSGLAEYIFQTSNLETLIAISIGLLLSAQLDWAIRLLDNRLKEFHDSVDRNTGSLILPFANSRLKEQNETYINTINKIKKDATEYKNNLTEQFKRNRRIWTFPMVALLTAALIAIYLYPQIQLNRFLYFWLVKGGCLVIVLLALVMIMYFILFYPGKIERVFNEYIEESNTKVEYIVKNIQNAVAAVNQEREEREHQQQGD